MKLCLKNFNESYEVFEKLNKLHVELKTSHEEMGINHINLKRTHAELEDKVKELESSLLVKENSQSVPIQIAPRIIEKEVIKTICNQCANKAGSSKDSTIKNANVACATNSTFDEAMLAKENALLKGLLKDGLLRCYKGTKTLREVLEKQIEFPKQEGLGFVHKYNDDGRRWSPSQYPKTKFVKPKDKGIDQGRRFEGYELKTKPKERKFNGGVIHNSYAIKRDDFGNVHAHYTSAKILREPTKKTLWVPKEIVVKATRPTKVPNMVWVPKSH